jgi:tRNA pseudouridine38-40 synthase
MVRNLVGTFVQAGAHRISPDSIPTLLAVRNRSAAGPTAPASGLFLVNVEYPPLVPGTSSLEPNA